MVTLNFLHEASVLTTRRRFQARKPYYTGGICVAVNPYAWLNLQTSSKYSIRHICAMGWGLMPTRPPLNRIAAWWHTERVTRSW